MSSDELDFAVAKALSWTQLDEKAHTGFPPLRFKARPIPQFSLDYAHAFRATIRSNLLGYWRFLSYMKDEQKWVVFSMNTSHHLTVFAEAQTPAGALCLAIVKAREIQDRVDADVAAYQESQKTTGSKTVS
jgi:hypothetical protein